MTATAPDSSRGADNDAFDVVIVAVVAAVAALPLWLARFPIAQDLPAHIETAAQIRALWSGDVDVAGLYRLHGQPWPNATPVLLLAPLLGVVDGLVAAKLLVAAGVVGWPVSIALLLRRFGRSPLLALLVIPTSFDLSFGYGFLHFVVGKPLWGLCLVSAVDVAHDATIRRLLRLALLLMVLFATHLMLFATAVPLCAVVVVVCANGWRTRLRAAASTTVGALPAVWWVSQQPPTPAAPGASLYLAPGEGLRRLWSNLGDLNDGSGDALPWIVSGAALVVALALGARLPFTGRTARHTVAAVVVAVAVLAFAWLGPVRLPQVSIVAERFWSLGVALLVCAPPLVPGRRGRAVVVGGALLATGLHVVDLTRHWRAFSQVEMGEFDALLDAIPRGSRVATHYVTPLSPHGRHNALWHWGKLAALDGSATDDSFAWRSTCVVGLRAGARPPRHPGLDDGALRDWDFLLVRGSAPVVDARLRRLAIEPVMATGSWRLFRVTTTTTTPPTTAPPTTAPATAPTTAPMPTTTQP